MNSSKLKRVLSGVSALVLMSTVAGQAAAAVLWRFVSNGDYAYASVNDGATCGSLYVSRGGTGNNSETYLFYVVNDCATGVVAEEGYGKIANTDLQGDASGKLTLTTNTSGANFSRDVGAGGPIKVEWTHTSDFSSKGSGTFQTFYGDTGYSYLSNGTGQMYSARAQGSVVGRAISTSHWDANMGKNTSVGIEIDRGP